MRSKWYLAALGGLSAIAVIAAACGPASEPSSTPTGAANRTPINIGGTPGGGTSTPTGGETSVSGIPLDPDAKFGGTLRTAHYTEGPSFSNWEEAAGITPNVTHPMLNKLVRFRTWGTEEDYANAAFFEWHPDLATDWEQSADGLTWTFNLRDDVVWSDGTPLTCADVAWSFETIRTGEGLVRNPRVIHFAAVESFTCPDDYTFVVNLERPKPAILEILGMPYHVIRPQHVYEGNMDALRNEPPGVTSGPFTVTDWIPGERYILDKNPDYWDAPLPYLDRIEVQILSRTNIPVSMRADRLDVGESQGYTGGPAENLLAQCSVCQFWPPVVGSTQSPAIFLNKERAPWNDPVVNEAVALAIDNQKYVDVVQLGWYDVPTGCGFYPQSEWAMPAERCAAIPGYGDYFEGGDPAADKERARQILAEAGYAPGELTVTMRFWNVIQQDAPAFVEDLQAVGINVTAEILETARAYEAWAAGDFDIGVHSFWVAGLDPDITLYEHFYTGSERNYNRYKNPEFDALVDEMSGTTDPEARRELAWDAMEMALRDYAKIIVAHTTYLPAFGQDVRGLMPSLNYLSSYGEQNRYDHVWLDR